MSSNLLPIVSLAGPPELHERATRYNDGLTLLHRLEDDLRDADEWNARGRFNTGSWGLFSSSRETKPPMLTSDLAAAIGDLRAELRVEREAIHAASRTYMLDPFSHPEQENA